MLRVCRSGKLSSLNSQELTSLHRDLEHRFSRTIACLTEWSSLNTYSLQADAILSFVHKIKKDYDYLYDEADLITPPSLKEFQLNGQFSELQCGPFLHLKKRSHLSKRVLLCIHSDTVFSPENPFQSIQNQIDNTWLNGPGVADAKGGLFLALESLAAFEKLASSQDIGWDFLLVSDEEIGSPASSDLTRSLAKNASLGLVFEPALPHGNLVSSRPGSWVFNVHAKGKAAHAGRELEKGENAITALIYLLKLLDEERANIGGQMNIGLIQGGTVVNQVPDSAVCQINIRAETRHSLQSAQKKVRQLVNSLCVKEKVIFDLHTQCLRPPKEVSPACLSYYKHYKKIAKEFGIPINWEASFGVSDANFMADEGLPTLDTLGPIGRCLHSSDEAAFLPSFLDRSKILCCLLNDFAKGVIT